MYDKQVELEKSESKRALNTFKNNLEKLQGKPQLHPSYNQIMFDAMREVRGIIQETFDCRMLQKGRAPKFWKTHIKEYFDKYSEQEEFIKKAKKEKGVILQNYYGDPVDMLTYLGCDVIISHAIGRDKSVTDSAVKLVQSVYLNFNIKDHFKETGADHITSAAELIHKIVEKCSFFELINGVFEGSKGDRTPFKIKFTDEFSKKLDYSVEKLGSQYKYFTPMICKPKPRVDLTSGDSGYLITESPLMKNPVRSGGKVHPAIENCTVETAPRLFNIINTMQEIAYSVDKEMLDIMDSLFEYIDSFDGEKFDIHKRSTTYCLEMADRFKEYEELYFPLFVDQRGRMYPYCNSGLSYNSDDLGKSLIQYSTGELLSEDGVESLKFALGEYLGVSKKVGPIRMDSIEQELPEILRKYEERDWSFLKENMEDPFGMVSLVKELYNYYQNPEGFLSKKVLHSDSCASGLQLFGLFTGCYDTLVTTNVINPVTEDLQDLYMNTAYEVEKNILGITARPEKHPEEKVLMASLVMAHPEVLTDRKVYKTCTMTYLNYASTQVSCYDNIVSRLYSGHPELFLALCIGEEISDYRDLFNKSSGSLKSKAFPLVAEFCKNVWLSMQKSNPTAVNGQAWIKRAITNQLRNQDEFVFINPLNQFPVVLRKEREDSICLKIKQISFNPGFDKTKPVKRGENPQFLFKEPQIRFSKPTGEITVKKTVSSSLPSTIHSGDAAVMMLICEGLGYVTGIHDSAGTRANDAKKLKKVVGEVLHKAATCGFLESLQEQTGYKTPPPVVNTLKNLEVIKDTQYAFM